MADRTNTFYTSDGWHGYGSQLLVGQDDGSPETFKAVAFVKSIAPGDMSTEVHDRSHMRSPQAHREKVAGMRDSGAFSGVGIWVPTEESQSNDTGGLMWLWRTRTVRNFKIALTDDDTTEWPFRGVVTKFQPGDIGLDDTVDFSFEITPISDFSADLP